LSIELIYKFIYVNPEIDDVAIPYIFNVYADTLKDVGAFIITELFEEIVIEFTLRYNVFGKYIVIYESAAIGLIVVNVILY
jgi:hypothetical protein